MNGSRLVNILLICVISSTVTACSFSDKIAKGMGYVPAYELDQANKKLTVVSQDLERALTDLDEVKSSDYHALVEANREVIESMNKLEALQGEVDKWEGMRCRFPDGSLITWEDLTFNYATYLPSVKYQHLYDDWRYKAVRTQWKKEREGSLYGKVNIVLIDNLFPYSFAVDITDNCVILYDR